MFSKIRLAKFQGFNQTTEFQLKPLTLVFGPNASGKSSITRSLLLLKQSSYADKSLLSNSANGFLYDGPDISLASFANLVHQHEEASEILIGVQIDSELGSASRYGSRASSLRRLDVTFRIGIRPPLNGIRIVYEYEIDGKSDEVEMAFERVGKGMKLTEWRGLDSLLELSNSDEGDSLSQRTDGEELIENAPWTSEDIENSTESGSRGSWNDVSNEVTFNLRNNFPSLLGAPWRPHLDSRKRLLLNNLLSNARFAFVKQFRDLRHIGPLRTISERLSYEAGLVDDDSENPSESGRADSVETVVSKWLFSLTDGRYRFQPVEFYAEPVKFLGSLRSQILVDTASNTPVTFADVGVGLSQVLPILQAMHNVQKRSSISTLLVEQPELHLHPAMQANLADLFIEAVMGERKVQILAETHSEAMLMRVQRRLREGTLSPDLVQILYVDRGSIGNQVRELNLSSEEDFSIAMPISFTKLRLDDLL